MGDPVGDRAKQDLAHEVPTGGRWLGAVAGNELGADLDVPLVRGALGVAEHTGRRMVVRVVEHGWSLVRAAHGAEVSERTCAKWVARYRAEGEDGLCDRSTAPLSIPHRTPVDRIELIEALRRLRMTGAEVAECPDLDGSPAPGIA